MFSRAGSGRRQDGLAHPHSKRWQEFLALLKVLRARFDGRLYVSYRQLLFHHKTQVRTGRQPHGAGVLAD
jgi:hypothetical protein